MLSKGESWFVCQTHVRQERRAKYFLEGKGLEVYLPMMEVQRFLGPRPTSVQKPLFTNYVFVRCDRDRDLPYVRWTEGVRKILPESIRPVGLDDQVVESIRTLANKDGIIRNQLFKKRDKVRILRGPFKELMGAFEEWSSDQGRVRILLQFVNCQARVELHHTLVERVV